MTLPFRLDHNRILIAAHLKLPSGQLTPITVWVDTGNPDLWITERLANALGRPIACQDGLCTTASPPALRLGTLRIPLDQVKKAEFRPGAPTIGPGLPADLNLPSTVLRAYDLQIDYRQRQLSIGPAGTIGFEGPSTPLRVNPENGLAQVAAQLAGLETYLGLDIGASTSFLTAEVAERLDAVRLGSPSVVGAIGPANLWGSPDEPTWRLVRANGLQVGELPAVDLIAVALPPDATRWLDGRAGGSTGGLLGANALRSSRIGIDYAHGRIYLDRLESEAQFGVSFVGLVLRPERDGSFTIIGTPLTDGAPAVPEARPGDRLDAVAGVTLAGRSMGQAWALLSGRQGQERVLRLRRGTRPLEVRARIVCWFCATLEQRPEGSTADTSLGRAGQHLSKLEGWPFLG